MVAYKRGISVFLYV